MVKKNVKDPFLQSVQFFIISVLMVHPPPSLISILNRISISENFRTVSPHTRRFRGGRRGGGGGAEEGAPCARSSVRRRTLIVLFVPPVSSQSISSPQPLSFHRDTTRSVYHAPLIHNRLKSIATLLRSVAFLRFFIPRPRRSSSIFVSVSRMTNLFFFTFDVLDTAL